MPIVTFRSIVNIFANANTGGIRKALNRVGTKQNQLQYEKITDFILTRFCFDAIANNYVHIVSSTTYRQPIIHPPYDLELYSYLGGICNNMESPVLKICGLTDHVHILCMLSKKNRLDEVAGRVEIAFIQVDKNQR